MTTVFYFNRDGKPMVQETLSKADGETLTCRVFPVASKPAAIAYAKAHGFRFTA